MSAADQLADLARRVAALEQAQQAPAPSFAPLSGLTVQPDGSTLYDFVGHVHGQGLDLDARAALNTGDSSKLLSWLRGTWGQLGALAAGLAGVAAADHSGALYAIAGNDTGTAVKTQLVLDSTGASDFLRFTDSSRSQLALYVHDTGTYAINGGAAVAAGGSWTDTYIFPGALPSAPAIALPLLTGSGTVIDNVLPVRLVSRSAGQVQLAYRFVNGASSLAGDTARFLVLMLG